MQDISELQRRITAALERIGGGLDALGGAPATSDAEASDAARLQADLDAERARTADLEERLQKSRDGAEAQSDRLESEITRCRALIATLEEDRGRMKASNDALAATLQELRELSAGSGADAKAIDRSMATELEALHAARRSDRDELDAVLALLGTALEDKGARDHA